MAFIDQVKFGSIPLGLNGKESNPYLRGVAPLIHYPFIPTFGVSTNASDALAVLADALYTFVRHFNSGSRNYAASDLFQYLLAVISAHLLWAYGRKALGIAKLYDKYNRVLGESLALANHINIDDIRANTQDFTKWLNLYAKKLATFVIPNDIAILPRWFSLVEGIISDDYTEGQTKQLYDFGLQYIYKYDWENSKLVPIDYVEDYGQGANRLLGFKEFVSLAQDILGPLQNSDDVGTISGDLLKAYTDNYYILDTEVSEDYVCPISRATNELLAYIRNADLIVPPVEGKPVAENFTYFQSDSILRFEPIVGIGKFDYSAMRFAADSEYLWAIWSDTNLFTKVNNAFSLLYANKRVVDFLSDTPTDEEKAAALLGKLYLQNENGTLVTSFIDNPSIPSGEDVHDGAGTFYYAVSRCGSEILVMPTIYYMNQYNAIASFNVSQIFNHINMSIIHCDTMDDAKWKDFLTIYRSTGVDAIQRYSYYVTQFDCLPNFFTGDIFCVDNDGDTKISDIHVPENVGNNSCFMHGETHNVKFFMNESLNYALEDYCWDALVNDLWLTRRR